MDYGWVQPSTPASSCQWSEGRNSWGHKGSSCGHAQMLRCLRRTSSWLSRTNVISRRKRMQSACYVALSRSRQCRKLFLSFCAFLVGVNQTCAKVGRAMISGSCTDALCNPDFYNRTPATRHLHPKKRHLQKVKLVEEGKTTTKHKVGRGTDLTAEGTRAPTSETVSGIVMRTSASSTYIMPDTRTSFI